MIKILKKINYCEAVIGGLCAIYYFTSGWIILSKRDTNGLIVMMVGIPFLLVALIGFRGLLISNKLRRVDFAILIFLSSVSLLNFIRLLLPFILYQRGSWIGMYLSNIHCLMYDFILLPLLIIHIILVIKLKSQQIS